MSLTTRQKTLRKISRHLPNPLSFPVLTNELAKFSLLELLDEAEERARFWSHCAVGERFEPKGNLYHHAEDAILHQGFSKKQAEIILEAGFKFDEALLDALEYYRAILKTLPNQHAIVEKKPE